MAKCRIFYCLGLFGLLLFYIFCNSYTPVALLSVLLSFTVFGILITVIAMNKLSLDISPVQRFMTQKKDQHAEFCITVRNNSIFPISSVTFEVEIRDLCDDGAVIQKIKMPVGIRERKSIHTVVSTSHSAVVECRVKKPRAYDAFGLLYFRIKDAMESAQILISPLMNDESFIQGGRNAYMTDSDKYSETQKGDDPSQVFEVRDYVPGDDIRRIHWRLSSKQDNLIVKEYSKPMEEDSVILLETGIAADDPEQQKTRSDKMLSVFMKLAYELIENEQAVTVYWYSNIADKMVSFDISIFYDAAPVAEKYLSEKYSKKMNITLMMSEQNGINISGKQVYYLYNSDVCDKNIFAPALTEKYNLVDTSENKIQSRLL